MPLVLPKVRSDLQYFEQQLEGDDIVIVCDPVRNQYFKYNPLQAAMLRSLDGVRTIEEMIRALSNEYEVEIPRASADRFIARARDQLLLDVSSADSDAETDAEVMRLLARKGLRLRDLAGPEAADRIHSAEAALFVAGLRQLQAGHPSAAADYFEALLEHRKNHPRARKLVADIQAAYIKVLASPRNSDFTTHPVFDPYRLLSFLDRLFGKFLFGLGGVLLLLGLIVGAVYSYSVTSYPALHMSAFDIVLVVLLVLGHDLVHELGHGWACMHYGGAVHEIGVAVVFYVTPSFYCDTSATYLMTEKRHRIIVQAAGTIGTIVVVCVMLIALATFSPSVFFYTPVQLALWYLVPFIMVNFWPLMKLDGYYALCDFLGVTNLRDRSIGLLKARLGRLLLGLDIVEEELEPAKQRLFLIFGSAAAVFTALWIYFVTFRVLVFVVERFRGPGLVIAAMFLYKLLRKLVFVPGWQLAKLCYRKRRRVFTIKRSLVYAVLATLVIAPWTYQTAVRVDAPFVLIPKQRAVLHVQTDGFVDRVLVHEGDHVQRGQVLAKLRNPELDRNVGALAAKLEQLDARLAMLEAGKRHEEVALAREMAVAARATYAETAYEARSARELAAAGIQADTATVAAAGAAAVDLALAGTAAANVALLEAGERPEDIAVAVAERAQVAGQLDKARADQLLLTIESPIDGVIVTKRFDEWLGKYVAHGDPLIEVDDTSSFYAEIHVPPGEPLDQLAPGDHVVLESYGAPGTELGMTIDHMRNVAADDELVIVTTGFTAPGAVAGIEGHARMFGRRRSLAYSMLYLPLQRVYRVQLWSIL